ncbi:MAG: prolyl oligopeptidase family serine peptidase [Lentisphaerales bacterium]|nr:prolyl oligopeptidase family serine peptidase [Lentisphaerales bacterium]
MKYLTVYVLLFCLVTSCTKQPTISKSSQKAPETQTAPKIAKTQNLSKEDPSPKAISFTNARKNFTTKLTKQVSKNKPGSESTNPEFRKVSYLSTIGKMEAYISQNPKDGKKHPAIIWLYGGFSNSADGDYFEADEIDNDQSAMNFHNNGIITMFPSSRGGNANPGHMESFYGEVDDIIAAYDFLSLQPYVDPDRIYLGGHSTGGTLALLISEATDKFRASFSLGPVSNFVYYGDEYCNFDTSNIEEIKMRAPLFWLDSITKPTFVFEGTTGNIDSLLEMKQKSKNPLAHFYPLKGYDHFNCIYPLNELIAQKILADKSPDCEISFNEQSITSELNKIILEYKTKKADIAIKKATQEQDKITKHNDVVNSLNILNKLRQNLWNDIKRNRGQSAKVKLSTFSNFFKSYSAELATLYKKASKNDQQVIKFLRASAVNWYKSDLLYIINQEKFYALLDLSFKSQDLGQAISNNDYALKEISKLDKAELHFLHSFMANLKQSFAKLKFDDPNLKTFTYNQIKSYNTTIKRLKPVSDASKKCVDILYNINVTAMNNKKANQLHFKTQSDVNYFNKQIDAYNQANKALNQALNNYYSY